MKNLLVVLTAFVFVACDTDPATDKTDTSFVLHGSGGCPGAGWSFWWTYETREIFEDGSRGPWYNVGPSQNVNCGGATAEGDLAHLVTGATPGTNFEYRILSYMYNTGRWSHYDSNGTEYGTDYDQYSTTQTKQLEGGTSECNPYTSLCTAGTRRAYRQLTWVNTWDRGIGVKNQPSADTFVWRNSGAVSILLRCRVDAKLIGAGDEGVGSSGWIRPANNANCWAKARAAPAYRFVGTRHYIRAYLNDTSDWWLEGFPSADHCSTGIYSDGRDLLKCDDHFGADPPARSDP
jgi:hypothetical protein